MMTSSSVENALFEKLKVYKNSANSAIAFKYIFDHSDLEESNETTTTTTSFHPEFTHQIFGDDESIFGYKSLSVEYMLTPGSLHAFIGLSYKEKIAPRKFGGIESDDVYAQLDAFGCSPGYDKDLKSFASKITQDKQFKPFGKKVWEYSVQSGEYEIYKVDSSCTSSPAFISYLVRVQTILAFFIETFSFLDSSDPQWSHFFVYERQRQQQDDDEDRYVTMGYASIYNFYSFPDRVRERISQVLIFPQYQHAGHGAQLVQAIYSDAIESSQVTDVTAEDPSSEFVSLRDFVTTKMCLQLDSKFKDKQKLIEGDTKFVNELIATAKRQFKMPKLQSLRCYEIVRLAAVTNRDNQQEEEEEWNKMRLDIKKRLYMPFFRKSKFARNKTPKDSDIGNDCKTVLIESQSTTNGNGTSSKRPFGIEQRMGESKRFKKDLVGVTTIGFGNDEINVNGKKSVVSFSIQNTNTSDHEDDDDDNESTTGAEKLFLSKQERKDYLEKEYQQALLDYSRIIKRLENNNVTF
jgi:histone acetyltransferase 1